MSVFPTPLEWVRTASGYPWVDRVLPHIKRLDDCFSDYLVRLLCDCGAHREIQPGTRTPGRVEDDQVGAADCANSPRVQLSTVCYARGPAI